MGVAPFFDDAPQTLNDNDLRDKERYLARYKWKKFEWFRLKKVVGLDITARTIIVIRRISLGFSWLRRFHWIENK